MKIALVHDYIKEYGGAERVLEALHELYPDAPVFTTVYLSSFLGPHKKRFDSWEIRESWVKYLPFREKLISPLRLLSPLLFRSFDFSAFDVVIVSATGAYTPNTIQTLRQSFDSSQDKRSGHAKRPLHVCYCHTPPRYLYGYATARQWKKNIVFRVVGEIANHFLRLVDYQSAQNVDFFIANSVNVQKRIEKFYRRDSVVIYPPVEINSEFRIPASRGEQNSESKKKSYYLAGGRLARPKHIDFIVQACRELNLPLKVFGKEFGDFHLKAQSANRKTTRLAGDLASLAARRAERASQNPKIEFVGEVSDEEKFELMKNAKAYIFAAEDEDFGITPVEAMAAGTPVIAYRSGGVVESIVDGRTGIFFDELTIDNFSKAVKRLNDLNHLSMKRECVKRAQKFSKERFKTQIQLFINSKFKSPASTQRLASTLVRGEQKSKVQ